MRGSIFQPPRKLLHHNTAVRQELGERLVLAKLSQGASANRIFIALCIAKDLLAAAETAHQVRDFSLPALFLPTLLNADKL